MNLPTHCPQIEAMRALYAQGAEAERAATPDLKGPEMSRLMLRLSSILACAVAYERSGEPARRDAAWACCHLTLDDMIRATLDATHSNPTLKATFAKLDAK